MLSAAVASAQTAPQLLPYTLSTVAGGGSAAIAAGAPCPVSGLTSTDSYGDGCLATEVKLSAPRFVTSDRNGAVFFSDTGNALIRRIDPATGIITAVAGGASSSPAAGAACGTAVSTDIDGDGCQGTQVKISKPEGLAFSPAGDLYFADNGYDNIRKVAATGGVITTTGTITQVAGGSTYGYAANQGAASGVVLAATQSYTNFPYGIAFDAAGNLYLADEGNNAVEVFNLTATPQVIQGIAVPAGTVAKLVGYGSLPAKSATSGECPNFVSTSSRGGCYYGSFTTGSVAAKSNLDNPYDVAVDASGNLYVADEYLNSVAQSSATNVLAQYAGIESTLGKTLTRATAGTFAIGSDFNVAVDATGDLYVSDASNGVVWRVDAPTKTMYVIAGGASTVCSAATNTSGDGCPGPQGKLSVGTLNSSGFATAPGVAGISVDAAGDLLITDATTGVIREAASGTQFGNVGASAITHTLEVHFSAGDAPARTSAYSITSGSAIFSVGAATCTANTDGSTDCLLPVTATPPTTLGAFTGNLQVTSTLASASFKLTGTYVMNPGTRLALGYTTPASTCTGTNIIANTTAVLLTATITSTGTPTGTVQFYANGTAIGQPVPVANGAASLTYTFATPATYTLSAKYSGDSYFTASTGTASSQVVSTTPSFTATALSTQQNTVSAGQTALYSFSIAQSVYAGTITFACSGLPANSTCQFSPTSVTATGCSAASTVALSILTQQAVPVTAVGFSGRGVLPILLAIPGMLLAFAIGLRRRDSGAVRTVLMVLALFLISAGTVACGSGSKLSGVSTPSGTYTITVTASGSTGTSSNSTVQLTVK